MKQKTVKPPLFRITKEIWEATDPETWLDTQHAMMEMDLWHPPYKHFVVETTCLMGNDVWDESWKSDKESAEKREWLKDKYWRIEYKCDPDENFDGEYDYKGFLCTPRGDVPLDWLNQRSPVNAQYNSDTVDAIFAGLIILLATKNADKTTIINDPRSRTHRVREDAKKYSTTTTIKIGAITETMSGVAADGRNVRPHLRRGHIRQQRFGEGLAQVKKVFIEPCFVNADKEWVNIDKNYKVIA